MNTSLTKEQVATSPAEKSLNFFVVAPWLIYVFLSPLYLFPNGMPQIADYCLVLGIIPAMSFAFINYKGRIPALYLTGLLFVAFTMVINLVNYSFFPDRRFLMTTLVYAYNFLVFAYSLRLFRTQSDKLVDLTYWALIASVGLQLLWIIFVPDPGWRTSGTFNNPNQLAYWVLLTGILLVFLRRGRSLTTLDYAVLFLLGMFQTYALSKAGLITYIVFLIAVYFTPQMNSLGRAFVLMGALSVLVFSIFNIDRIQAFENQIDNIETAVERLESIGQEGDDNAQVRGYDRLINFPEYLFLGAGEGAFWRFDEFHVRELHSGPATLLFSYGVIGTILFLTFIYILFSKQSWYYLVFLAVIMLFGLTHQNIRFTHFWVFLAISYASIGWEKQRKKKVGFKDTTLFNVQMLVVFLLIIMGQ